MDALTGEICPYMMYLGTRTDTPTAEKVILLAHRFRDSACWFRPSSTLGA